MAFKFCIQSDLAGLTNSFEQVIKTLEGIDLTHTCSSYCRRSTSRYNLFRHIKYDSRRTTRHKGTRDCSRHHLVSQQHD